MQDFKDDVKIGDAFGKSWDTHWFLVEVEVPESWISEEYEVHFIWESKCEAALYTVDGSKLIQAFTEKHR